jgi:hypothetical protein
MIADELRRQADTFLELNELSQYIARAHRPAAHVHVDEVDEPDDDMDDDEGPEDGQRSGRYFEPA